MNLEGRTIWQHAAGKRHRNHSELCFKWDAILSGGPKHLKQEMKKGDIVVLKLGRTTLLAIGILGPYERCAAFDDIDGWRLGHTRRVHWLWQAKEPVECPDWTFSMGTTKRLGARSTIIKQRVRAVLTGVDDGVARKEFKPFDFPDEKELEAPEIASALFEQGLASDAIRTLLDQHGSFSQMAKWYSQDWKWASEDETVCHLVVPLLRVLGWTPQRIGVEFNRVDVALFARLPRRDENVTVVIEAKQVHGSCLSAISQARDYARRYRNCSRIIVTDGLRYGIYVRSGNEWPDEPEPYAYLNVIRPRAAYPIYGDLKGAKEAIYAMTPDYAQVS